MDHGRVVQDDERRSQMKKSNPNTLLERDVAEAARAGLSYGVWRSIKDSRKLADKVHFRRAQQVAELKKKRGKKSVSL